MSDQRPPFDPSAAASEPRGHGDDGRATDDPPLAPVVDYAATWRRMRRTLAGIGILVVVAWLVRGALGGGLDLRTLAELLGFGLLLSFAAEVVVIGGSALRGMLAAGERGDRLSSPDVSLFPPQVGRRTPPSD